LRHSTSKNEDKKKAKAESIRKSYEDYLEQAEIYIGRAEETYNLLRHLYQAPRSATDEILTYINHAKRQIDQIRRRVLEGEKIPHEEKVFSIFEPHTEWISKGKAGVSVELGLRVCIIEDSHGFILHHKVMERETDEKIAVEMVNETIKRFYNFSACSFDKGFHSQGNQRELKEIISDVILPKKGKLSKDDELREYSDEFILARRKHSAVESAINALQVHGLNKCRDHGIDGFKRYVSISIVARNIQKIGAIILNQAREKEKDSSEYKKAA